MKTHPPLPAPDAIARLRSKRQFDPARPLPDHVLLRILHLATLVPSEANLQPWRFLVVRNATNRRRLRACVYNRPEVADAPAVVIVLAYLHPHRTHLDAIVETQHALGLMTPDEATKARAIASSRMERRADLNAWARGTAMRAEAALLIAAESLGVASATVEEFDANKVIDAFGIPNDHLLCTLVALGYTNDEEPSPGRLALGDVCYEEHFGQPWTLGES